MKQKEKQKAIKLRKQGCSINKISKQIGASKSSVSCWVSEVKLSMVAKRRIIKNQVTAREKSSKILQGRRRKREVVARKSGEMVVRSVKLNRSIGKIICAMVYWCEGNKNPRDGVSFTNSDPHLIATFLELLRSNFLIDELKLRVCMHLHDYHNEATQLKFWSKTTRIPKEQFTKTFHKSHTGKREHARYQGCIRVRYSDIIITRELLAIGEMFMKKYGPIVQW